MPIMAPIGKPAPGDFSACRAGPLEAEGHCHIPPLGAELPSALSGGPGL
jgi:hypothetical protein